MIHLNGQKITPTMFPDKTSQVWHLDEELFKSKSYDVTWEFEHEGELFQLYQLMDLLKHAQVPRNTSLYMPFLPYGRQDKEVSNNNTFALKTFCNLIDKLNFDSVETLDAHSDEASKWIRNFRNVSSIVSMACVKDKLLKTNVIAFPDTGACNRYFPLSIFENCNLVVGNKVRDQSTGHITSYKFDYICDGKFESGVVDKDVLIVDDICDGGMTFIILAKNLLQSGAKSVNLYVTHGIFSKGIRVLKEAGIDRIFTHKGEIFESKNTNFLIREYE